MTNEELMQLMTDMDLHEGGMENWVLDNAWLRVANAVAEKERNECAVIADKWMFGNSIAKEIRARGQE